MFVKTQDQNLAIRDSIGNQIVMRVELKDDWQEYTVNLADLLPDDWITPSLCPQLSGTVDSKCSNSILFNFDWSRVKQINFDMPFLSTEGTIYLDEIKIIEK